MSSCRRRLNPLVDVILMLFSLLSCWRIAQVGCYISVGHRPSLIACHTSRLHLTRPRSKTSCGT